MRPFHLILLSYCYYYFLIIIIVIVIFIVSVRTLKSCSLFTQRSLEEVFDLHCSCSDSPDRSDWPASGIHSHCFLWKLQVPGPSDFTTATHTTVCLSVWTGSNPLWSPHWSDCLWLTDTTWQEDKKREKERKVYFEALNVFVYARQAHRHWRKVLPVDLSCESCWNMRVFFLLKNKNKIKLFKAVCWKKNKVYMFKHALAMS